MQFNPQKIKLNYQQVYAQELSYLLTYKQITLIY